MRRFINEKVFIAGIKYKFSKCDEWYTCPKCDFYKNYKKDIYTPFGFLIKKLPCAYCNHIRVELRTKVCLHEEIY